MDGLHIVRVQDRTTELNNLSLILRRSNLEIMHQLVTPEDIIWVSPADSPSLTEIFLYSKAGSIFWMGTEARLCRATASTLRASIRTCA